MINDENVHPKHPNFFEVNSQVFAQVDFVLAMISRATSAKRPIDHKFAGIGVNQSLITERLILKKYQPQTQTISVISDSNINTSELFEGIFQT